MDRDDFKGCFNLVLLVLFIGAMTLGPLIERWRKRKEAERRRAAGHPNPELEPPPAPAPPRDQNRPRLPYEHLLEEVFGPYIERRRQAAEEARRLRIEEIAEEEEAEAVDADEEIRRMREARRPAEEVVVVPAPETPAPRPSLPPPAAALAPRRARTLDEMLFRNPRLSPGAKLLLASEILGKPRSLRRR